LGETNNKCGDLEMGNQQQLAIATRCLNKLNACIVKNNKRGYTKQLNEGDLESTVDQVCDEMTALFKSNSKLRDDISRTNERADASHTATHKKASQLSKFKADNASLLKEKLTLSKQLRVVEDKYEAELGTLKVENHRLNTEIANANVEIGKLKTEIGIRDTSIDQHQSGLETLQIRADMFERQLRDSNARCTSFLESNNALNTKLSEINDSHEKLTSECNRIRMDSADESKVSREELDKANGIVADLHKRLEFASQKVVEAEKKTTDYSQQISCTMQTNRSLNDTNVGLRDKLKKTNEHLKNTEELYETLQSSTNDNIRQLREQLDRGQRDHDSTVSQLHSQLEELINTNELRNSEITRLNAAQVELAKVKRNLEGVNTANAKDLQTRKETVTDLEGRLRRVMEQAGTINDKLTATS
ncbi:hypothetical protein MHBO_003326, partial [Bonamia ostreae]